MPLDMGKAHQPSLSTVWWQTSPLLPLPKTLFLHSVPVQVRHLALPDPTSCAHLACGPRDSSCLLYYPLAGYRVNS